MFDVSLISASCQELESNKSGFTDAKIVCINAVEERTISREKKTFPYGSYLLLKQLLYKVSIELDNLVYFVFIGTTRMYCILHTVQNLILIPRNKFPGTMKSEIRRVSCSLYYEKIFI